MMGRYSSRILGVLLIIMALVTTGQTAWYSYEQQKCNEIFARNLAERSKWSDQDRQALNNLIITVFENQRERAQEAAYRHWRRTVERNTRLRSRVSLPDLAGCD